MPAQLRLELTDEEAARLDELKGPATRTAYATHVLRQALASGGEDLETMLRRVVGEEVVHAILLTRQRLKPEGETDESRPDARNAIRNLPSMR